MTASTSHRSIERLWTAMRLGVIPTGPDIRYHASMTAAGFAGGLLLLLLLPLALLGGRYVSQTEMPKDAPSPLTIVTTRPVLMGAEHLTRTNSRPAAVPARSEGLDAAVVLAADSPRVAPVGPAPPLTEIDADSRARQTKQLEKARDLIVAGDLQPARQLLAAPDMSGRPEAAFLLAESFDPNVLAAIGLTSARSEVERARVHYRRALELGLAAAERRLEALE